MKHIFLNLKRFDIPGSTEGSTVWRHGGMGELHCAKYPEKAEGVRRRRCGVRHVFSGSPFDSGGKSLCEDSPVKIGCQGVYRDDTAENGNFGAFTTNRTANAAKAMGCSSVIIGTARSERIRPEF